MSPFIYKYHEYHAGPFSHAMIYAFRHHKKGTATSKKVEEIFGVVLIKCRVCSMSVEVQGIKNY